MPTWFENVPPEQRLGNHVATIGTLSDSNVVWAKKSMKKGPHMTKNRVTVLMANLWIMTWYDMDDYVHNHYYVLVRACKNCPSIFFLFIFWQWTGGVTMTLLELNPSIMPIIWRSYSVFHTDEAAAETQYVSRLVEYHKKSFQLLTIFFMSTWNPTIFNIIWWDDGSMESSSLRLIVQCLFW